MCYGSNVWQLWTHPAVLGGYPKVKREDPSTWEDVNWPTQAVGFLEATNDYALKEAWKNRQNPKIVELFQNILGTSRIPTQC